MIPLNNSKTAHKNNRLLFIAAGLTIGIIQTISFSEICYATENLNSVPLGFRVQAVNKTKEKAVISPLTGDIHKNNSELLIDQPQDIAGKPMTPNGKVSVAIPNLFGIAKESATFQIGKSGLTIGIFIEKNHPTIPFGNVIGQIPVFGGYVGLGSAVDIIISSGPSTINQNNKVSSARKDARIKPGILKWTNKPLGEVLEEIKFHSGIEFKTPSSIKNENINVEIHAETWRAAIKKLLRGYSTVEMFNGDGQIVSLWIMRDKTTGSSMEMTASNITKVETSTNNKRKLTNRIVESKFSGEKKINRDRSESNILLSKLQNIKKWPSNRPLPSSIYDDAHLQSFLVANGIASTNDLQEPKKIKQLKRAARKQVLLMKMRARSKNKNIKK